MTPDKNIVAKIQAYDRDLFIKWNGKDAYWELWRKKDGIYPQLITPVCPNIYEDNGKNYVFTPLDERILAWIYAADSHKTGNQKRMFDERFSGILKKKAKERASIMDDFKHRGRNDFAYLNDIPRNYKASRISNIRHVPKGPRG